MDEISKKSVPGADLRSELLEGLVILKKSAAVAASIINKLWAIFIIFK